MKGNGVEKLREETGHSACAFQRTPEAFSGHVEWLEIICRDCGEKVSRCVSSIDSHGWFLLYEDEDLYDPTVQELMREMRKSFCKELDWNRIWF